MLDKYVENGDVQQDIMTCFLAGWDEDRVARYIAKKYSLDPQYVRENLEKIMFATLFNLDLGGWF